MEKLRNPGASGIWSARPKGRPDTRQLCRMDEFAEFILPHHRRATTLVAHRPTFQT